LLRIGAPSATRAVARACATNNIVMAILAPSRHRAIRNNGALSDYIRDVDRKRQLLDREALVEVEAPQASIMVAICTALQRARAARS
jgi:2-C-methyl-D-erythritol 4-phosphate cytidylyltransferase